MQEIESPFEREALRASCNLGKVQFIVDYDHHRHVLLVRVVQATNLIVPANIIDHNSDQPCNPYAIIQLLPDFENQLQTNVKRKTSNPRFDETFEFDIETKKIQDQSLWITLMSFDSFAKHDVIGQAVLSLREVDLAKPNVFLKDLEPSKKVCGAIVTCCSEIAQFVLACARFVKTLQRNSRQLDANRIRSCMR